MLRKLLLVDDSITIHKVVELILTGEGFEIKAVNDGEEALAAIPTYKPDIVLADVEMPKMNGYLLCEKIKQDPSVSGIPVLLLAGAFEPFDEESAKKVGADGFVIKPFESQELINKINEALKSPAALKEKVPERKEKVTGEEDLWAMEEMPELGEIEGVSLEEEGGIEKEAPFKVAKEIGVGPEPKKSVSPLAKGVVPAEEAGILEAELPSKDELKEIFEKTLNGKVSSLLSSIDIKETIQSTLMPLVKDPVEKIISQTMPDLTERVLKDSLQASIESLAKDSEQLISKILPELMERILKDTLSSSLDFIVKATEKTIGEVLPGITERTLREEIKVSLEPLKQEIEKVIWKTVPDLAEAVISKEIERIRSEF